MTSPSRRLTGGDWVALAIGTVGSFFMFPAWLIFVGWAALGEPLEALSRDFVTRYRDSLGSELYTGPLVLVPIFIATFYAIVTRVLLRNIAFRAWLKYPFCVLVAPVFLFLLVVNVALVQHYLPMLFDKAAGSGWRSAPERRGKAVIAGLVTAPLGVAVCFVWYKLSALVDRTLPSRR